MYSDQTLTFVSHSKKNSEVCPSNQVPAAIMTSTSEEKWRPFNCFFQSGRAKDLSVPLYIVYSYGIDVTKNCVCETCFVLDITCKYVSILGTYL